MNRKIKIALIGTGGYANVYINHLLDNIGCGKYELVGAADPDFSGCAQIDTLRKVCKNFYGSAEELFADRTADLTIVSTPIHIHAENVITALEHGSNVLCEKPLCGDTADIGRMIAARERAGKFVMIGYQWCHSDAILSLKRDILDGLYGKPLSFKAIAFMSRSRAYFTRAGWAGKRRIASGVLVNDSIANNAAAHYLHNLLFLCGESLDTSAQARDITGTLLRANDIENFDTVITSGLCGDGIRVSFIATHAAGIEAPPRFTLLFEKGMVTLNEGGEDNMITGYPMHADIRRYGNPDLFHLRKLELAIDNAAGVTPFVPCGIETAAMQVRYIEELQKLPVRDFEAGRRAQRPEENMLYIDGLYEELCGIYEKIK